MCAFTTCPFFSFTRNVVLGKVSTTSPSICSASSLAIKAFETQGRRILHKALPQSNLIAQECLELHAGNGAAAESGQVRRGHLAVDDGDAVAATSRHQVRQRHFRGIALPAEHGFREEHASQPYPI